MSDTGNFSVRYQPVHSTDGTAQMLRDARHSIPIAQVGSVACPLLKSRKRLSFKSRKRLSFKSREFFSNDFTGKCPHHRGNVGR
jgi:hypothetical protein